MMTAEDAAKRRLANPAPKSYISTITRRLQAQRDELAKTHPKQAPFPTKEEILAFIGEKPGKIGTREIARAFNLKNDRRIELKRLLRELVDEGRIGSRRKK